MPTADILYNPIAGRLKPRPYVEQAAQSLKDLGWEIEIYETRSPEHTTELARQAADKGKDALFIAGGDGSLNEAIRGLYGSQTALGVLPAGTGNVWAQEIGLRSLNQLNRKALLDAAQALGQGRVQCVDVGVCNDRPFLLWSGYGLDAEVVKNMERNRKGRRNLPYIRYAWYILSNVFRWRGLKLKLNVDGQLIHGRYVLALVSNVRLYGGGFSVLSPQACIDDGELDLWLFPGGDGLQSFRHVSNVLSGRHTQDPLTHKIVFKEMRLRSKKKRVQLDGDSVKVGREVYLAVAPRSLRVLVPPEPPAGLFNHPPEWINR